MCALILILSVCLFAHSAKNLQKFYIQIERDGNQEQDIHWERDQRFLKYCPEKFKLV